VKVLVTGGAGFIGSHLVDRLIGAGHEVTILDVRDPRAPVREATPFNAHLSSGAARLVEGDVTDPSAVAAALAGCEAVVHLAAAVGVGRSSYRVRDSVQLDALGAAQVLEAVASAPGRCRRLVLAGSAGVYGEGAHGCPSCGSDRGRPRDDEQLAAGHWEVRCARCGDETTPVPTPETRAAAVVSVFAAAKKLQEELFLAFGAAHRIPTLVLRLSAVVGPGQALTSRAGVAPALLARLLSGRPPLVYEDGHQSRDFVDVRDAAEALLLAVESSEPGGHAVNVASGRRTSVLDLAEALAARLELDLPPQRLEKARPGDARHSVLDVRRARELLGFRARRSLDDSLGDLVAWSRGQAADDRCEADLEELLGRGLLR
jgi:dTDP-L-rhamnose 4-epimerase